MALLTQCIYAYRIRVVAKLKFLSWCIIVVCKLQIMHCAQLHTVTDDCVGTGCHRGRDSGGIYHRRIFCASIDCEWHNISSDDPHHLSWGSITDMEHNFPTDRYDNSRHIDVVCKSPILSSARMPCHILYFIPS